MTRPAIKFVPALLCAALIACTVGPAYRRPEVTLPAQWRDRPASPAASAPAWPEADWWRAFGSARLNELIAEAERSNDDIAGAVARVQEADAQARIAGAALLPSIDASGSGTRQRGFVPLEGAQLGNSFNAILSASYELDFWGKNRATRDAARAAAIGSRYDRETLALSIVSSVAVTYFQAL